MVNQDLNKILYYYNKNKDYSVDKYSNKKPKN